MVIVGLAGPAAPSFSWSWLSFEHFGGTGAFVAAALIDAYFSRRPLELPDELDATAPENIDTAGSGL